jgi:hypothetical protein
MDGWVDGWMDGWMDGWESRVKDCLQQSKNKRNCYYIDCVDGKLIDNGNQNIGFLLTYLKQI